MIKLLLFKHHDTLQDYNQKRKEKKIRNKSSEASVGIYETTVKLCQKKEKNKYDSNGREVIKKGG